MYYRLDDPGATASSKPRGAWPSGGALVNQQRPKELRWKPPSSRDGIRINRILQPVVADPKQQPVSPFAFRAQATVTPRLDGQVRRVAHPVKNVIVQPPGLHYNPITLPKRSLSAPRQQSASNPSAIQRMPSQPAAVRPSERTALSTPTARTGPVTSSTSTSLTARSLHTPVSTRTHAAPHRAAPNSECTASIEKSVMDSDALTNAQQAFRQASARQSYTPASRSFCESAERIGAPRPPETTATIVEMGDTHGGAGVRPDRGWWVDVQILDAQMCAELGLRGEDFWSSVSVIGEDGGGQMEENAEACTPAPVRFEVMGDVKATQLQVTLHRKHVEDAQLEDIVYHATVRLAHLEEQLAKHHNTNVWIALVAGSISPNCTPDQLSAFCLRKGRLNDSAAPARLLLHVTRVPMARKNASVGSGSRQEERLGGKRESARKMEDNGGQDQQQERPSSTPTLELEERLSSTKNELKILQQVMSFQERRIEGFEQAQQQASSEEDVTLLYSKLERMNSTVVLQKDTIASLDEKCRFQAAQLTSMVMKSQELEDELRTRESVSHAARKSEVQLDIAQRDITKLTSELQTAQSALEEKERASVNQTAVIESLQSSLKMKSQELESRVSQTAENAKKMQERTLVIHDLNRRLQQASEAIETAVGTAAVEANDANNELTVMQNEFQDIQDQLQMYHQELLGRNGTIEELRAELLEEKAANKQKSLEIEELMVVQRDMQAKLDIVSKTVDHYLPDAGAQISFDSRANYRLTPDAVSTPQKGHSNRHNLRQQEGFRMKFDQSPLSSLSASAGRANLSALSYEPNPTDDIDVLFAEAVQRKARQVQAIIVPNGTIRRTGKGKYGMGEHKIFLRAFDGPCGKELKVRRGGTFQLLEEWIDACAASSELEMDLDGQEEGNFALPNPYAPL